MVEGGGGGAGGPQKKKMAPCCTTQADPSHLPEDCAVSHQMMMGCFEGSLLQLILTGLNLSAGEI